MTNENDKLTLEETLKTDGFTEFRPTNQEDYANYISTIIDGLTKYNISFRLAYNSDKKPMLYIKNQDKKATEVVFGEIAQNANFFTSKEWHDAMAQCDKELEEELAKAKEERAKRYKVQHDN